MSDLTKFYHEAVAFFEGLAGKYPQAAPAINAAMEFAIANPRSQWPCQSTRIFSPDGWTTCSSTNLTRATAPIGVAWPAVSQSTSACAPKLIAAELSCFTVSGSHRVVSSVTYITSRPSETAYLTAFSVV